MFFAILCALALSDEEQFAAGEQQDYMIKSLIEGEWDVYPAIRTADTEPPYFVEFHTDFASKQFVGSVWKNGANPQSLKIHQIEDAQLGQFVIQFRNQFSGNVLDFINPGEIVTPFSIKPTPEGGFTTQGKLDSDHFFTLNYNNSSDIHLYVTTKGQSSIDEYVLVKPEIIKSEPMFGKYTKFAYILGIIVVVQFVLLLICKCSANRMQNQIDDMTGRNLKKIKTD